MREMRIPTVWLFTSLLSLPSYLSSDYKSVEQRVALGFRAWTTEALAAGGIRTYDSLRLAP